MPPYLPAQATEQAFRVEVELLCGLAERSRVNHVDQIDANAPRRPPRSVNAEYEAISVDSCAAGSSTLCHHNNGGGRKYQDAEDREGVAEAHDQRLLVHNVADGDYRLAMCLRRIDRTASREITGHLLDAIAHGLAR
jgi:hypothetical protein